MFKILITDKHGWDSNKLEKDFLGADCEVLQFDKTEEVTDAAWAACDGVVTYRGSRLVTQNMDKMKAVKIIVRGGVGFDGLDLKAFGSRGIPVCNVPDYGTTDVADHAISLLMALRRGLTIYEVHMRENAHDHWHAVPNPCIRRLRGQSFGVLGLDRIGLAAARRAKALDMEVGFYDPHLPDGADLAHGFRRFEHLEEFFEHSDNISVHTPFTEQTHHIVNADMLSRMKEHAVLVNTSRGPTVDVDALYHALHENMIAGAALDVWPTEPPQTDHPLIQAFAKRETWLTGRFMLTPHAAFYTPEGVEDMRLKSVKTVADFLRNKTVRNCQNEAYLKDRL